MNDDMSNANANANAVAAAAKPSLPSTEQDLLMPASRWGRDEAADDVPSPVSSRSPLNPPSAAAAAHHAESSPTTPTPPAPSAPPSPTDPSPSPVPSPSPAQPPPLRPGSKPTHRSRINDGIQSLKRNPVKNNLPDIDPDSEDAFDQFILSDRTIYLTVTIDGRVINRDNEQDSDDSDFDDGTARGKWRLIEQS